VKFFKYQCGHDVTCSSCSASYVGKIIKNGLSVFERGEILSLGSLCCYKVRIFSERGSALKGLKTVVVIPYNGCAATVVKKEKRNLKLLLV